MVSVCVPGEAGTGIGELIAYYLHKRCGMTLEAAHRHCYFMDTKGLVCASRTGVFRVFCVTNGIAEDLAKI